MSDNKKKTTPPPEFGLCIDWETSGAVWGGDSSKDHQGLSFGAIVFRTKNFEPVEKLYRLVQFNEKKYKWTEGAQKVHGLTKEFLLEKGVSQEEAAIDLAALILKYWGPDSKVMLLGHNVGFDISFTAQLLAEIEIGFSIERPTKFESWIQLHHVVLDTSALGFVTLGLFKSNELFERIGFEKRGDHNALADAEMTLQTCQAIKQLVEIGLSS